MIYRDILNDIHPWLQRDKIVLLKGARQVGKTTILKYLMSDLKASGTQVRYMTSISPIPHSGIRVFSFCAWPICLEENPVLSSSTSFKRLRNPGSSSRPSMTRPGIAIDLS